MILKRGSGRIVRAIYNLYMVAFFVYLLGPLLVMSILAFNNSPNCSFPWKGFTLKWFFSHVPGQEGVFGDVRTVDAIVTSLKVALFVTLFSVVLGTLNAFLFERWNFWGKRLLYFLMLGPVVMPGVILGISILSFSFRIANFLDNTLGMGAGDFLRPGFWLIVMGQLSFCVPLATMVIAARLRKFDPSLEEAAMDLGASWRRAILEITIPFLIPGILGGAIIVTLFSFVNFNTTFFLAGTEATLPILLFSRLRFGLTPQVNAVGVVMVLGSFLVSLFVLGAGSVKRK